MHVRPAALLALAALPLAGVPASLAAPKPPPKACQLLTDDPNDTGIALIQGMPLPVEAPSVDILSADVATGAKTVVGTLRMRSLRSDTTTASGSRYHFFFTVNKVVYEFRMTRTPDAAEKYEFFEAGNAQDFGTAISGRFDEAANAVVWTIDRKMLPKFAGAKFSDLSARAGLRNGTALDNAASTKTYADRQPSCVPAA